MLRPYQIDSIDQIRAVFKSGKRKVLLHLSTGAGKTVIFSEIMKQTVSNGKRCAMIVRGRMLVEQACQRLLREQVPHGVLMANHWNENHQAPIQLCSVDTLISRGTFPDADLVVIDEAHMAVSDRYKDVIASFPNAFVISVTATPYSRNSMEHLAQAIVHPITMSELVDQGYLLPARYYTPSAPDLDDVKVMNGDYVQDQLQEKMNPLTGNIPRHWEKIADGRPTVCFAVNINHSEAIVAQFESFGIRAMHIEAGTKQDERDRAIRMLKSGEISILSNVGILCTGVDIPEVSCLIMARPTKSYNLYIQQAGRGTRTAPGKNDFIILDHAGNVLRHGMITDEPEVELKGVPKGMGEPKLNTCTDCFCTFVGPECPGCGKRVESTKKVEPIVEPGILKELEGFPKAAEITLFIRREKDLAKRRGYKHGYVYHRVREAYGDAIANAAFPWKKRDSTLPWFLKRGSG